MTLRRLLLITLTAVLSISLISCDLLGTNDDGSSTVTSGVYVANQGNFNDGNGSVTLYDPETEETTPNAIDNLNSIVQSVSIRNDRLYLAANSGGRLDVFNASDQSQLQQLGSFSGPRYLAFSTNATAFLTDQSFGGPSSVEVLDLSGSSPEVTASIEVPGTPEGITTTDSRVYAALGGFSDTTLVAAINPGDPGLTETIDVDCTPRYVVADLQDEVFVPCTNAAEVVVLDGSTGDELARLTLPAASSTTGPGQPAFFSPDAEELYVSVAGNRITRINTAINEVETTLGPLAGEPIGAVGYDAVREELYVGHVPGFTEQGTVTIHQRDGTQTGSFSAGVAPTYIDFRRLEE